VHHGGVIIVEFAVQHHNLRDGVSYGGDTSNLAEFIANSSDPNLDT
jgi:hypothetical protein